MIFPEIDGCVLNEDYRLLSKWLLPIASTILMILPLKALIVSINEQDASIPGRISAVLIICIGIFLLIASYKNAQTWSMTYHCDRESIENCCKGTIHSLNLNSSFYISELPVKCAMKGAIWHEHFLILSSYPFSSISGLGESGLGAIDKLWKKGIIILPAGDEVKAWLGAVTGIGQIPQYPKVAYLQKDDFWRSCE